MIFKAIILGIVQGLTEFIPVSSSGHLLGIRGLLHWNDAWLDKSFDVALHLGTLVALVAFYWQDWMGIFRSFVAHVTKRMPYGKNSPINESGRLLIPIVVACIPAALVGWKFDNLIEAKYSSMPVIVGALVAFGVVMLLAERLGKRERSIDKMNYVDYISIGLAQALALVPGVSRSGITISTGLFRNLDRAAAARFSFLLSTPIIFGAGLKKLKDIMHVGLPAYERLPFILGFATAAIVGYFAIKFLLNFLQKRSLDSFAIYRFVFAALMLAFVMRIGM